MMGSEANRFPTPSPVPGRPWRLLALGLILLAGAALRLPSLDRVPYGIWYDEAINGQDALDVWKPGGHFRIFYSDDVGFPREPMYQTILAFTVRAAGASVPALRATSGMIGLLTILLVYLFGRRWLGEAEGLAAAGVLATLRWHVLFSRLIFRTLLLGPWMLGLIWTALAYRQRPAAGRIVLLGVFIGGGFYTYLSWWFMLPVVAGVVVWLFRGALCTTRGRKHLALLALAAALTYLPLGIFFIRHPEIVLKRPGAVSVFSGGVRAAAHEIARNAGEALLMFHFWGDHVAIQNLSGPGPLASLVFRLFSFDPIRAGVHIGYPALDPLQGVLFLAGLLLALIWPREKRPLIVILLAWLAFGMATTVFTHTDSPNFLRTLCLTPPVALLTGLGLAGLGRLAARHWGRAAGIALVTLALAASAALSAWDIYGVWARRTDVWRGFHGDLTDLARAAGQAGPPVAFMMPRELSEHPAFRFQTFGRPNVFPYQDWSSLLGPLPPLPAGVDRPRAQARWVVVTAANGLFMPLQKLVPEASVIGEFRAPEGNTWGALLALPEGRLPSAETLAEIQKNWRREMTH